MRLIWVEEGNLRNFKSSVVDYKWVGVRLDSWPRNKPICFLFFSFFLFFFFFSFLFFDIEKVFFFFFIYENNFSVENESCVYFYSFKNIRIIKLIIFLETKFDFKKLTCYYMHSFLFLFLFLFSRRSLQYRLSRSSSIFLIF